MSILGIRCSSKDFSYCIVNGKQESATLADTGTISFPKGYTESETQKWLSQEIEGIIKKYNVHGIGIKGVEPMGMKGKAYGARMEKEGIFFLQAALCGVKYIKRKVKSTIAKDLGIKGKGKYLETKADFTKIVGYEKANKNTQESIQVAISMLN